MWITPKPLFITLIERLTLYLPALNLLPHFKQVISTFLVTNPNPPPVTNPDTIVLSTSFLLLPILFYYLNTTQKRHIPEYHQQIRNTCTAYYLIHYLIHY